MKNTKQYYDEFITHFQQLSTADYSIVEIKKETLEQQAIGSNTCIAIYDFIKDEYEILHWIFDTKDSDRPRTMSRQAMAALIHPSDIDYTIHCKMRTLGVLETLPPEELGDYKIAYECRMKDHRGIYHRIIHQFMVLQTNEQGKIWLFRLQLNRMASQDNEVPARGMIIINSRTNKKLIWCNENCLTPREIEIAGYLAEGYDSKKIAQKLFISKNTVDNHRRNILRKTQTSDTGLALLYARTLGLI